MSFDEKLRWYGFWTADALTGRRVRSYYDEIRDSYLHGTSIAQTQEKLQRLIAHAAKTTEYYGSFRADTPLEALPVVNKETFRNHYDAFRSSMYRDAPDNRIMCTSGSTGTPFQMIQNRDKILHNTAGGIFLGAAGGYYIGMKEAFIRVWVNNVKKSRLQLLAENQIMMDSSRLDEDSLRQMCRIIKDRKVKCLVGYSSALEELSRYIAGNKIDTSDFSVRAVIPISESMPAPVRRQLREQFGCPVRAWYSNEENGIMGLQRPEDESYDIDTESYYYEILKLDSDEPAEPGEIGRIVITDLYNYAFPILRYDNGDTAVAKRLQKNGRYRLKLTELYGRRSDMIFDCCGRALTPYVITNNMWDIKGVKQFHFIQSDADRYILQLNGRKDEISISEITARLMPYLGEKARLSIEYVDEIPVLSSGKRKYIENLSPLKAPGTEGRNIKTQNTKTCV